MEKILNEGVFYNICLKAKFWGWKEATWKWKEEIWRREG